jgi:glycerol-3-phosphate O-acyltransferase/dihydroxyacetone phosphate acyltransferase
VSAFRRGLVWTFRRIIGVYFREIEVLGEAPSKGTGGRLFVSNHVNGIVDPILVLTIAPCDISPVGKATLWKVPGLRFLLDAVQAVQIVRRVDDPTKQGGSNDAVFDRIAAWLDGGGNILIFPEGTSHSQPHLVELKTGAARMLLRASEAAPKGGGADLTFQAVALEFDAREKFRSRALLVYGPVRRVRDFDERGDAFIAAVTEKIREDLSELLVEGATWDERRLIAHVAEMLAHDAGDPTLAGWNAIGRQVEAARRTLAGDPGMVETIRSAVDRYYRKLDDLGLEDADIAGPRPRASASLLRKLYLVSTLPFAATGYIAYAIPYWIVAVIAGRVKSRDETSTIKLGAGLVLHPLWAAALVAASLLLAPRPWSFGLAALALISPFAAVSWLDATPDLRRSVRALFRGARLDEARSARAAAMEKIKAVQERLGF